jgi:PadR family transcriptional regulator PadR
MMLMSRLNLTFTTGLILQAIATGHRYGFQIMGATGLPGGTVYPALRRLEGAAILSSAWEEVDRAAEDGRPTRRYYQLTPSGIELLGEALARFRGIQWAFGPDAVPSPGEA